MSEGEIVMEAGVRDPWNAGEAFVPECPLCSGKVARDDPAAQALEWGVRTAEANRNAAHARDWSRRMVEARGSSAFWALAHEAHVYREWAEKSENVSSVNRFLEAADTLNTSAVDPVEMPLDSGVQVIRSDSIDQGVLAMRGSPEHEPDRLRLDRSPETDGLLNLYSLFADVPMLNVESEVMERNADDEGCGPPASPMDGGQGPWHGGGDMLVPVRDGRTPTRSPICCVVLNVHVTTSDPRTTNPIPRGPYAGGHAGLIVVEVDVLWVRGKEYRPCTIHWFERTTVPYDTGGGVVVPADGAYHDLSKAPSDTNAIWRNESRSSANQGLGQDRIGTWDKPMFRPGKKGAQTRTLDGRVWVKSGCPNTTRPMWFFTWQHRSGRDWGYTTHTKPYPTRDGPPTRR